MDEINNRKMESESSVEWELSQVSGIAIIFYDKQIMTRPTSSAGSLR